MNFAVHTVGVLKHEVGDARIAPFVDAIDTVFSIASRSDGYLWHFERDASDAAEADRLAYQGDLARLVVTLSLWRSVSGLKSFVWDTLHGKILARTAEWSEAPEEIGLVFWQVEEGQLPTLAEAKRRLTHLNAHGDSDHAFGWSRLNDLGDAAFR